MRAEKKRKGTKVRLRTQRDVLQDVMLSANECGAWLTLNELAAMTRYPAASISAQLRHLKKPMFGNFVLKKRIRETADIFSGNAHGVVWEYRLTRRRRVSLQRSQFAKSATDSLALPPVSRENDGRNDIHSSGL
jgi:hypothetical protein